MCDGISAVVKVVALTDKPLVIAGVWFVNTVVNAVEPPELAAPETTRNALLSCVVCFVHPVGAAVCWNNINVPEVNVKGVTQDGADAPFDVKTCPEVPAVFIAIAEPVP